MSGGTLDERARQDFDFNKIYALYNAAYLAGQGEMGNDWPFKAAIRAVWEAGYQAGGSSALEEAAIIAETDVGVPISDPVGYGASYEDVPCGCGNEIAAAIRAYAEQGEKGTK